MCRNRYTKAIDNKVLTILRSGRFNYIYCITIFVSGRNVKSSNLMVPDHELSGTCGSGLLTGGRGVKNNIKTYLPDLSGMEQDGK